VKGIELLQRTHLFPVRHHSPRSSAVLAALLREARPRAVLIEAPEDATPLIGATSRVKPRLSLAVSTAACAD